MKEQWVPECFDIFFVSAGAADDFGGLLGFDSYEQDYFGISPYESFAEDEAKKKLMRMTKEDLITSARQCFKVYQAYIGLRHRYDCLKSAMDILKDKNTGYIKTIKEIEKLVKRSADFRSRVLSQILQPHTVALAEHRKDQKIRLH